MYIVCQDRYTLINMDNAVRVWRNMGKVEILLKNGKKYTEDFGDGHEAAEKLIELAKAIERGDRLCRF